jgi:hypothetical protein
MEQTMQRFAARCARALSRAPWRWEAHPRPAAKPQAARRPAGWSSASAGAAVRALVLLLLAVGNAGVAHAQDARTTTVQAVARDWLALVDRGDYAASWNAAGAKFRLSITTERWSAAVKSVRTPIGPLTRRTMLTTSFADSFPGAPKGDYAIVVFRTSFEKKDQGQETVTLEHEGDGRWRVIGYTVR